MTSSLRTGRRKSSSPQQFEGDAATGVIVRNSIVLTGKPMKRTVDFMKGAAPMRRSSAYVRRMSSCLSSERWHFHHSESHACVRYTVGLLEDRTRSSHSRWMEPKASMDVISDRKSTR